MKLKTAFYLTLSLSSVSLFAQKDVLDPVTVTASLSQQRASATGRDIFVIKGVEFDKLPIHSLDELLRYIPGIEVQQRGTMGAQSDILIRGGTFQQVLVILDGIRINDPLTGHFNSYIPVSPFEIDHIEIMKGASSAIYGTEAVGGVIQIISKSFAAKVKERSMTGAGSITGGEYGLFNANAGLLYRHEGTTFSGGVVSNNADGQPQRGINGFFHNTTVSASLHQILTEHWSISARSSYDRRNFAAQNFYTTFTSDTATEKVSGWWNQLKLEYKKRNNNFSFDAGYKSANDQYDFSKVSLPNSNHSKLLQGLAVFSHRFGSGSITSGLQNTRQSILSNDRGDHAVSNAAAFIIYDQELFGKLHLSPALRTDWNEVYGWELVPQLNASYKINRLLLRGSAGKTTRNADFTELYNNYNKTLVMSGNIGNPALETEHSFSWETGADYYFSDKFKLVATYFNKDYSRMIDWVNTAYADMPRKNNLSPIGNYYLSQNISSIRTSGVETNLQFHGSHFHATAGAMWLHSNSDGQTPSLYISSHAEFLFNYSVRYNYKWLQTAVNGLYKKRPTQSGNAALASLSRDYYIMNARIGASVVKYKFNVFVQADNIFDKTYSDRYAVVMPGRWLMGGINFSF